MLREFVRRQQEAGRVPRFEGDVSLSEAIATEVATGREAGRIMPLYGPDAVTTKVVRGGPMASTGAQWNPMEPKRNPMESDGAHGIQWSSMAQWNLKESNGIQWIPMESYG